MAFTGLALAILLVGHGAARAGVVRVGAESGRAPVVAAARVLVAVLPGASADASDGGRVVHVCVLPAQDAGVGAGPAPEHGP